jgi:uncharacterized membrane protein
MMAVLAVLAVVGLLDSWYIFYKKQKNEKLVCFIGQDCNEVLNSRYSHIYGVPNEVLGIIFYLSVLGMVSLVALGVPALHGISLMAIIHLIAFFALLLSIFLTAIQAFVLKAWCEYCLIASLANLGIFVLAFFVQRA